MRKRLRQKETNIHYARNMLFVHSRMKYIVFPYLSSAGQSNCSSSLYWEHFPWHQPAFWIKYCSPELTQNLGNVFFARTLQIYWQ